MPPATSARARTAITSTDPAALRVTPPLDGDGVLDRLRDGELEVIGRLIGSSNNAMVVRVWPSTPTADELGRPLAQDDLLAVWKPTRGERPPFDFPIGTLTRRVGSP